MSTSIRSLFLAFWAIFVILPLTVAAPSLADSSSTCEVIPILFAMIEEYIVYEQRLKALKTVGLDRLEDMDRKVSREFSEDGIMLSGGETQKLALARLLMDDFGLMILDEPSTAHLTHLRNTR